jgi:hypothetical protein
VEAKTRRACGSPRISWKTKPEAEQARSAAERAGTAGGAKVGGRNEEVAIA